MLGLHSAVLFVIMEERRRYIEQVISENSNNEREEAAIRDYAIKEEVGFPTPQNDLPNLKKNRIDIELVNRTNQDSVINLFALPQGINPEQDLQYGELFETKYSEVRFSSFEFAIGQTYTINWIDQNGVPQSAITAVVNLGITELITELISVTGDNWSFYADGTDFIIHKIPFDTWVYWNPPPIGSTPPAGSQPASFYTQNSFVSITANATLNVYNFTTYDVLGGSGIDITEVSGTLTYSELTSALRDNIEPYIFNTMTIYADDIDQANVPITKTLRGAAGNSKTLIENPTIVHQNQFVVTEEISLPTKTLYSLDYKIKAFETVRIIITYTKGNLNAIADILDEYISDGIPFNVGIHQLAQKVSDQEKVYLESSLRSVWERKKRELALEGVEIEIESIFEPQGVIDERKKKNFGEKMQLVKNHIEAERLQAMKLGNVSQHNIKRLVANYAAKGLADKIYDPYSYIDGKDVD